jgi:hypothetical protein
LHTGVPFSIGKVKKPAIDDNYSGVALQLVTAGNMLLKLPNGEFLIGNDRYCQCELTTWDFTLRCIQTGAIILGGGYTLYEHLRFRRLRPKIQFDIDFDLYPIDNRPEDYLLDIRLIINNKGNVRKAFPEMLVNAKTLSSEAIERGLANKKRLKLKRDLIPPAIAIAISFRVSRYQLYKRT